MPLSTLQAAKYTGRPSLNLKVKIQSKTRQGRQAQGFQSLKKLQVIYWQWHSRQEYQPTTLHQDGEPAHRTPSWEPWQVVTGSDKQWGFQEAHSFHRRRETGISEVHSLGSTPVLIWQSSHAKHMPLLRNRGCNLSFPWFLCRNVDFQCFLTLVEDGWQFQHQTGNSCGFPVFSDEMSQCECIPTHTGDAPFPRLPVERGRKALH